MTSEESTSETAPIRRRVDLSATQVLASALAAITATVAASYLGVSGTVIGAAVASVLTVTGNAVYAHSLRTTRDRVRATAGRPVRPARPGTDAAPPVLPGRDRRPVNPVWRRFAFGTVAVFTTVLTVVTGIELVAGRPISDLVRGQNGSGTTLFDRTGATREVRPSPPAPTPATVTRTVTPAVVVTTPTVTRTAPPVTDTVPPTQPTQPTTTTPGPPSATTTGTGSGTSDPSGAATRG